MFKERTVRAEIGTDIYKKITRCVGANDGFSMDGNKYKVTGAKRINNTDMVQFYLKEI